MKKNHNSRENGITLIALVITIIVLLILAAVSIATLTGENGILTQATSSKDSTTEGKLKELVSVAIGGLQAKNLGDTSKITPNAVATEVNDNENRTDVSAEGSLFPTFIIFEEEEMKVYVDITLNIVDITENKENFYNVEGAEDKIAPAELFDYEVIDEAKTAAITISSLPTKKIKITRIKPEYCNAKGYNPVSGKEEYTDTNYKISYPGITDTLVIPYQVKYNGEMYTVVEVNLSVSGPIGGDSKNGTAFPNIKTIIYPNTVTKISETTYEIANMDLESRVIRVSEVENIILSSKLENIPNSFFGYCTKLAKITIPSTVTSIGGDAFSGCIGLTSITIPINVTEMGWYVFSECTNLENIYCEASPESSTWSSYWNYGCDAEVHWGQTGPEV